MKHVLFLLSTIILLGCKNNRTETDGYPLSAINIKQVKITDNFWLPKIDALRKVTIPHALEKCRLEGRMDNFLIAGGVMEGESRGAMPFDDTDLYKIIEGASYSLVSFPDKELEAYLDSLIAIIATGQEEDGYLTTWKTINPEKSPAWWAPPGDRWENLASSHELYNCGHLYEAAAAHYYATGKRNLLEIALKNADLLARTFGPEKHQGLPGHQIVETGLIKLYQITKEKKYLELAKHFLEQRGNAKTHELFGPYSQDHLPVTQQDEVTGHAVRAVYMYAGMTDIAALYNDSAYKKAVFALWNNMVNKKMYITGGIGAKHDGEAFGENYELPNLTAYSETCAAIGSVYWNHRLFLLTGNSKYYDVLERTLYNGVLAGISLDGKTFFYPNPLEADGEYTFNHGACTRQEWFDCSCCPTNLIRFLPSVPGLIYATQKDSLFVNLYISNNTSLTLENKKVDIIQQTEYPWNGNIKITVKQKKSSRFTMKLRIPGWARNEAVPGTLYQYAEKTGDSINVKVNGKKYAADIQDGYLNITRKWKQGDMVELELPMKVQHVITNKEVPDNLNKMALEYGPIVYCMEETDNKNIISTLTLDQITSYKTERRTDLLKDVNVITGNPKNGEPVVFIPYYAWSNRGVGKMKVWIRFRRESNLNLFKLFIWVLKVMWSMFYGVYFLYC